MYKISYGRNIIKNSKFFILFICHRFMKICADNKRVIHGWSTERLAVPISLLGSRIRKATRAFYLNEEKLQPTFVLIIEKQ